jgi:glutamine synthetase
MADKPKTVGDALRLMKDKEVKFLDLRFTDTKGKLQHVTADGSVVDEGMFAEGYAFDGSSIAGWKGIEASDMLLMPDAASVHIDPFFAQTTAAVYCDVLEPTTGEMYERDPRSIAKRAEAYLKQSGVGDTAVFGPEAEFFIFDDVRYTIDPYNMGFRLDSAELPSNSGTDYETGNLGHRPRTKGGYFPVPPVDFRYASARLAIERGSRS